MASVQEIMQLCRLCLIKDEVNTPIFEDVEDINQVFLKIAACLPIKVSREDSLPKRICNSCSYKLELFYEFSNTSTASEKQLLKWLNQLNVDKQRTSKITNTMPSSNSIIFKQEVPELLETHSEDLVSDDLNISSDAQDYDLPQQQLPYESVEFEFQQEGFLDNDASASISTAVRSHKRQAAVLESSGGIESDDDDIGLSGSKMAKTEDDIDSENETVQSTFVDLPSTSGDNDQPGPSGVGKATADAPVTFLTYGQLAVFTNQKDQIGLLYDDTQEKENIEENSLDSFYDDDDEDFDDDDEEMSLIQEENIRKILKSNYRPKAKPVKKLLCSFCGKYVSMLEKHLRVYHGAFKCDICITSFKTAHDLETHKELHGDNEYPCNECTLSYKRPLDYAYHSREHCALKTYSCPLCHFKTPSRGSVKIHIQHHEKDYKYTCEICDRGFVSNSVYTEHVEGHAGIKRFQCDICSKTFLYKRYLMVHRKLNHKKILEGCDDNYECHICQRKFSFEKSLIRHLSKLHRIGKDVSVECNVCNKKIANPYNLKMHMRTHTGEKPYVCETCGKAFTKRVNLKRHLHNLHD